MTQLSQQEGDCSSTEDRRQRKHDRRSASSSSAPKDRSSQVIVDVAQTRRNESRCSNRAGTLEQLREVIGRRVDRACSLLDAEWDWQPVENIAQERCDVVILPPVADEPRWGIEDRLESVQEARRRAGEQAVVAATLEVTKAATAAFAAPRGNDLMQLLMRRS